jgi:hypothetical protein
MAYVRPNQCGYSSFCQSTIAPLSSYIELGSESHRMPLVQDMPNEGFEKPPFTTSYKAQLRPSVLVATLFLRSHFQTAQTKINKSTPFLSYRYLIMAIKSCAQKPESQKCNKALPTKRTVSFVKFAPPAAPSDQAASAFAEKRLQSLESKRLYKRRGSKTPSMLRLTKTDMVSVRGRSEKECLSGQPRRLSLMSALRHKLEQSSLVLPHHERKLGAYALDMLS